MNYEQYMNLFSEILHSEDRKAPYDDKDFYDYAKLNFSRSNRWQKTMQLDENLLKMTNSITEAQHWIIITEPWCGDAAHSLPFLVRIAENSPLISYEIQLRDTEPMLIDQYLTNGTRSIPKLIARNAQGEDLFIWGARPAAAQKLMDDGKAAGRSFDDLKTELQNWYNQDKGKSIQEELKKLLKRFTTGVQQATV